MFSTGKDGGRGEGGGGRGEAAVARAEGDLPVVGAGVSPADGADDVQVAPIAGNVQRCPPQGPLATPRHTTSLRHGGRQRLLFPATPNFGMGVDKANRGSRPPPFQASRPF